MAVLLSFVIFFPFLYPCLYYVISGARIKIVVVVFQIGIIIVLYSQPTFRHRQEAQVVHFCPEEASQSIKKKKDVRQV